MWLFSMVINLTLKNGISKILKQFIPMVLFYGYKFLKMGMQGKCVSFYSYSSFL